jgi:hypothetical protein
MASKSPASVLREFFPDRMVFQTAVIKLYKLKKGDLTRQVSVSVNQYKGNDKRDYDIFVEFQSDQQEILRKSFAKLFKYTDDIENEAVCSHYLSLKELEDELTRIKEWFASKGYN